MHVPATARQIPSVPRGLCARAASVAPAVVALLAVLCGACGPGSAQSGRRSNSLYTTGPRLRSLDPALAAGVHGSTVTAHLYDRLVEYDYRVRPYQLIPGAAAHLPAVSEDGLEYRFVLREGLRFAPDPCLPADTGRMIRAGDVVFSLLRIADARVQSPGYWIFRGYVDGLESFRERTAELPAGDYSVYENGISGLRAVDERTVMIRLTRPYPRLLNVLAMSYCGIVPEAAVKRYGDGLGEHSVSSGPFCVGEWRRNYRIVLTRNPSYRWQSLGEAAPAVPLDRVVCHVVQEPLTAWLLFLQGNLDVTTLSDDKYEVVVERDISLTPALRARGIRLLRQPQFQINYVAFNARDRVLGGNAALRRAISLAYDVDARVTMANGQLIPARGPIPPGVKGHDADLANPYAGFDLVRARELLAEAGYADGICADTGEPLTLTFDLGRTDLVARRYAEMMVRDMGAVGIRIEPRLNSWPRFLQRIRDGDVQLFRIAWIGDYPDGQNFLQLFYGPNAGSCNRAYYANPDFDALYEAAEPLPDCPERAALYARMQTLLVQDCPWIFESYPVQARLLQPWVAGYVPHHFAYDHWKYLSVSDRMRLGAADPFPGARSGTSGEAP